MRVILPCVTQEELNSSKAHIETGVTAMEAVLEVDTKCTNLIEDSMYDTKPVNYTSMVSEKLKLVIKYK